MDIKHFFCLFFNKYFISENNLLQNKNKNQEYFGDFFAVYETQVYLDVIKA